MIKKISGYVALVLVVLLLILAVNTLGLSSLQLSAPPKTVALSKDYTPVLAAAIRRQTLSPEAGGHDEDFQHLYKLLADSFPRTHQTLTVTPVAGMSRLYYWSGLNKNLAAGLFVAHTDVVPVAAADTAVWTHPPFGGVVQDDFIWGRGAMDDKAGVIALLAAAEELLQENFQPSRSLYFAFGHDEETGGYAGAAAIARHLAQQESSLNFILDEGGPIVSGVIPGIAKPVALIGITEKGYANIQLRVSHAGGHASMPPKDSAISILSHALSALEHTPPQARLNPAVLSMFRYLAPEMGWLQRTVFANLWLTRPLVLQQLAGKPSSNASIRTTGVATLISGGVKENILPTLAQATLNYRLLPGDTPEDLLQYIKHTINNDAVAVNVLDTPQSPAAISPISNAVFTQLQRSLSAVYPQVLVAPYQMVAITDSRHYRQLSGNIYRVRPQFMTQTDLQRIHGTDERISIEDFQRLIKFYKQFIINTAS